MLGIELDSDLFSNERNVRVVCISNIKMLVRRPDVGVSFAWIFFFERQDLVL